jgi:multidrug efflux pump subunit AcrA (membrane-fusion protein)
VFAHGQGPQQQPATPVEVALVIEREVVAGQTMVGTVMPARTSVVGSAVDGRVIELLVDEGDPVGLIDEGEPAERVGQPMVQLRTGTISIQVQAAQAELELRRQELAELENGTRPEEIVQAEARFSETKALMDYAKASYSRIERLFRQNTANREEMEQARSAALAAEQAHLAARAAHELAVAGPRKEKIGQARARVMVQEEEVRRIEDMRAKYTIRAPFVGYVVTKHAEVGQWVSQGDPLVEVVELDPVEIRVSVPASYVAHLREGISGRVRVDGLPGKMFTGEIWRIVPQADLRSRTFPVKMRLANPRGPDGHLLKSGMLVHVTLPVGRKRAALLVPKDALVLEGGATSVFTVGEKGLATKVAVQTGVADGALIAVTATRGDLKAGDQVVVRGNERLRPGLPVKIVRVATATE